jgi:hypothetical protein
MKKYCENKKCSEEICPNCGKVFIKPITELNRNIKKNRKSFCSISCAIQYRHNNKTLTEKENNVRENFKKYAGTKGDLNPSHKKIDEYSIFRETFRKAKMHAKQHNREFSITL